jgi:hypothetical protein
MEELKVGDRVKIADDSNDVRIEIAKFYGVFHVGRELYCGKVGRVVFKHTDRGNLLFGVTVPIIDSDGAFTWPANLLEKLPAEKSIHQAKCVVSSQAFKDAMLVVCGKIRYDFDSVEATCNFINSMNAVAKVEPPKPGVAEIVFDHVTKDGKCMLQIADIRGVQGQGLPDEYLDGYDCRMVPSNQSGYIFVNGKKYGVGQVMTEEEAAKLVKRMRACGKRLHDINVAARAKADEARLERWKAKGRKVVRI